MRAGGNVRNEKASEDAEYVHGAQRVCMVDLLCVLAVP